MTLFKYLPTERKSCGKSPSKENKRVKLRQKNHIFSEFQIQMRASSCVAAIKKQML